MHIVSWNVAGLKTTLDRIDKDYGGYSLREWNGEDGATSGNAGGGGCAGAGPTDGPVHRRQQQQSGPTTAPPPRCHAFGHYLSRHGGGIDILCVQEHKIPLSQLSSRSEPHGVASSVPGYESFWSCCTDRASRGMNGVVTFARIGTVVRADSSPLGHRELDEQGRCVMTDHGEFVLFNVYVPAGGANPLGYKMKFLNALRGAMRRQREEYKRRVILVGDLNISHRPADLCWKYRSIHVDKIIDDVRLYETRRDRHREALPRWKLDVAKHWGKIQAALETRTVVPKQTTNSANGEKFNKFTLAVTVDGNQVHLGKAESTEEWAASYYELDAQTYYDEDEGEERLAREANVVSVEGLAELMQRIAGVEWTTSTQVAIASASDADVYHTSPSKEWLNKVIGRDGMVDAFRVLYPNAKSRFTCWHQYTNRRYTNEGTRIDYTLVDKDLSKFVEAGSALRCGDGSDRDPLGEEAALHAATANGGYRGAAFEGGGIADPTQQALDMQFGPAHTGIIYTPPQYSDHVAVSLLLSDDLLPPTRRVLNLEASDRATRRAQPHKSQPSIASFFGRGGAAAAASLAVRTTSASSGSMSASPTSGESIGEAGTSCSSMSISECSTVQMSNKANKPTSPSASTCASGIAKKFFGLSSSSLSKASSASTTEKRSKKRGANPLFAPLTKSSKTEARPRANGQVSSSASGTRGRSEKKDLFHFFSQR